MPRRSILLFAGACLAIAAALAIVTVVVVGSPGSELRISDEDAITTLSTIWKKTLYGF